MGEPILAEIGRNRGVLQDPGKIVFSSAAVYVATYLSALSIKRSRNPRTLVSALHDSGIQKG